MPPKIDTWVSVNDFSPGIKARVAPSASTSLRGDPLGIAKATGTYRCQAMADNSLGPHMGTSQTIHITPPTGTSGLFHNKIAISGFWVSGPINIGWEYHIAWAWRVGTTGTWQWHRYPSWDVTTDNTMGVRSFDLGLAGFVDAIEARPTYFNGHRSAPGTDAEQSGVPQVACAYMGDGQTNSVWALWPDANSPTSMTPYSPGGGAYWPSMGVSHQGRHFIFDQHPHPHGPDSWNQNEDIYYTKENLQTMQSTNPTAWGLENATGYSAAVSTSFTELLLLKSAGGGILVRGDVADPQGATVLRIPSIPQIGTFHQIPAVSPVGVVFLTATNGAWLWTGAESTEHISADKINGADFFLLPGPANELADFMGRLWSFQDWVFFPNNWVWNWKQDNWFRLEDPTVRTHYWCGPDLNYTSRVMFAPVSMAATEDVIWEYDVNTPAKSYRWASQPLPIEQERQFTIREVVFVVSGNCNWTFNIYDLNGVAEAHTFTTTRTDRPTYIRQNCHVQCQELAFDIYSSGASSAGNVYEVRFGYQSDTHYPLNTP